MLKNFVKWFSVISGVGGILGAILLINMFLNNLKTDTYKEQIEINNKVILNVKNNFLGQMENEFNLIISNNLIEKLSKNEFVNTNANFSLKYSKRKIKENKQGIVSTEDGVFLYSYFRLPKTSKIEGSIQIRTSLEQFSDKVYEEYGKKIIFNLNESFLNNLSFDTKIKNFQSFLNNKLLRKTENIIQELNLIKSTFISNDLLELEKNGFLKKDTFFFTNSILKNLENKPVGNILVLEDTTVQGSTQYIVNNLEKLSQTIMISVMSLLFAGSLLLY
jgi:hypothetical protein